MEERGGRRKYRGRERRWWWRWVAGNRSAGGDVTVPDVTVMETGWVTVVSRNGVGSGNGKCDGGSTNEVSGDRVRQTMTPKMVIVEATVTANEGG